MPEIPWILAVNVDERELYVLRSAIQRLAFPCALVEREDVDEAVAFLDKQIDPALVVTSYTDEFATIRLLSVIGANGRQRHIRIWVLLQKQSMQTAELCRAYGATACLGVPLDPSLFAVKFRQVFERSRDK